jgi:hypothetical protein
MAIIGPADLPVVLKVPSDPMKKYALSQLGHPNVEVEISEDQFETALRTVGDWVAGYFPREQKLAVFYTQPLRPTYPMPPDAYWIQEVSWDAVTTRIDDVFGAESFLFCVSAGLKILARDGSLQSVGDWRPHWKARTPYGDRKLKIKVHDNKRLLPKIRLVYGGGIVEATSSHILALPPGPPVGQKWREFGEIGQGDNLCGVKHSLTVLKIETFASVEAITPRALQAGCYYGCTEGEPVLLH